MLLTQAEASGSAGLVRAKGRGRGNGDIIHRLHLSVDFRRGAAGLIVVCRLGSIRRYQMFAQGSPRHERTFASARG